VTGTNGPGKAWQVTVGGIGGVTAAALLIGEAIAQLTTSTRQSSLTVVTSVAIAGALVGGFVAAPSLRRLAWKDCTEDQGERSSPLRDTSSSSR
jgi:NhaP-type Na+/H+ or K+/H+ antiporter